MAVGAADGPGRRSQTLILNGFPTPDQVRLLGPNSGTSNRYALHAGRSSVRQRVAIEVKRQRIRPMQPPVDLTLRYVFSDAQQRDMDNFALVGKPAVDGLVRAGILAGDDAKRLRERVEFVKEKGARRLEIVMRGADR